MKITFKQSDIIRFGHSVIVEYIGDQIEMCVLISKEEMHRIETGKSVPIQL